MTELYRPENEETDNDRADLIACLTPRTASELNSIGMKVGIYNGYELSSRASSFVNWSTEASSEGNYIAGFIPNNKEGVIADSNVIDAALEGNPDPIWIKSAMETISKEQSALAKFRLWPETAVQLTEAQSHTGIDSWDVLFAHGVVLYKWGTEMISKGGLLIRLDHNCLPVNMIVSPDNPIIRANIPIKELVQSVKRWNPVWLPDSL